mgnify:CR=1 FL=1
MKTTWKLKKAIKTFFLLAFLCLLFPLFALDGKELLKKVDKEAEFKTMSYTASMEIKLGKESRKKSMKGLVTSNKAFIEFLNPEDKGVRYLKIEDNLWIYSPKERKSVKISGHLLKEGIMGSDLSYEDAMTKDVLAEDYSVTVLSEEKLEDRPVAILELNALVKGLAYEKRKMWIDTERSVILKEEMYAKSGRLLKTSITLDVQKIDSRWFVVASEMKNELRKNSSTIFQISNIVFDLALDESLFSLQNLGR